MTDHARAEAKATAERRAVALAGAAQIIAASCNVKRICALLDLSGQRRLARAIERVTVAPVAAVPVDAGTPNATVWSRAADELITSGPEHVL